MHYLFLCYFIISNVALVINKESQPYLIADNIITKDIKNIRPTIDKNIKIEGLSPTNIKVKIIKPTLIRPTSILPTSILPTKNIKVMKPKPTLINQNNLIRPTKNIIKPKPTLINQNNLVRPTPTSINSGIIPITSGKNAIITYFTDTTTQCYGSNIPVGNIVAINPLLLGYTVQEYTDLYANSDNPPWCRKALTLTIKNFVFNAVIGDTCDPTNLNSFPDPVTGKLIGGKCDYDNLIDLYGQNGLNFLKEVTNGNDFYDGDNTWKITL
jgi:hypothetical protein